MGGCAGPSFDPPGQRKNLVPQNLRRFVSVKNTGKSSITFTLSRRPTPTQTWNANAALSGAEELTHATASFSVTSLTVPTTSTG